MRLSWTLSRYLALQLLIGIAMIFGVFVAIILMADIVELLRRASGRDEVTLPLVAGMAILKLPSMAEKVLPFSVLFGATWTFLRLTRSHELVVTRASGVSVWQFLAPAVAVAIVIGAATVTIYNPVASSLVMRYEQLEATHLRGRPSLLSVSDSGLWLRQGDDRGQSVVHALRVSDQGISLQDVIVFQFEGADRFVGRIDATSAKLQRGYWELENARITGPDKVPERYSTYRLETPLTPTRIQDSFASPETLSFWDLPAFIDVLEQAGFSAVRHRLHWHSIVSLPLLLAAMVLIAAAFCVRATGRGTPTIRVLGVVIAGFVVFFLSDLALALGQSGELPVILAAWTPAGVSTLLGASMLFHLEDG